MDLQQSSTLKSGQVSVSFSSFFFVLIPVSTTPTRTPRHIYVTLSSQEHLLSLPPEHQSLVLYDDSTTCLRYFHVIVLPHWATPFFLFHHHFVTFRHFSSHLLYIVSSPRCLFLTSTLCRIFSTLAVSYVTSSSSSSLRYLFLTLPLRFSLLYVTSRRPSVTSSLSTSDRKIASY